MAVSSIFHNLVLDTPEKVDAFIRALEASEANPYKKPEGWPVHRVTNDPEETLKILELNEKNRAKNSAKKRAAKS